ncbi:threonine/serine exporter family protein [Lujinxingia sediminis]|uniref:Threonine/serine exporter family protein n=1 Tax=Lujinxingia sediminis TaxID=2480984 RepID=A0ABY0CRD7_9DELT|nr:threonine/serine exporter family protein [Lujinxingia sediminis]RVU42790.1 threonine/serine exporter family protein [Lujinxingia sediminis]
MSTIRPDSKFRKMLGVPRTRRARETGEPKIDSKAVEFVLRVGRALHQYGTPAHRLEEVLEEMTRRFHMEAHFFSTPTSIMAAFGPLGDQRSYLVRVEPGDVNLGLMSDVDEIVTRVLAGELTTARGLELIEEIERAPQRYPAWLETLCWVTSAAAAGIMFGGGWREMWIAGLSGLGIGLLTLLAARSPTVNRIFVALSAFIASFVGGAMAVVADGASVFIPMVAGLIVLLPGLTLTVALTELATRNLAAGAARLTLALMILLEMAFGVAVGLRLAEMIFGSPPQMTTVGLSFGVAAVALVVASISFTVLLRARFADVGWILGAAALAYIGTRHGTLWLGSEVGVFIAALVVGVASNAFARFFDRPASIVMVPGILLLVPGSVGFRSVSRLLERDVVGGLETAFVMTLVAASLVAGLLVANLLLPPRKAL